MSILQTGGKIVSGIGNGIGKILIPPKKDKTPEPKNFLHESSEEYAQRLMKRRSDRH